MFVPGPACEYLMTLSRPGGGVLCAMGAMQILVRIFPPDGTLSVSVGPADSDYAQIVFGVSMGENMVPDAFNGYLALWGTRVVQGTYTSVMLNGITFGHEFLWVTQALPTYLYLHNATPVNQRLEVNYIFLRIATEGDYHTVKDALVHMRTSAESERLLRVLAHEQPPSPRGVI